MTAWLTRRVLVVTVLKMYDLNVTKMSQVQEINLKQPSYRIYSINRPGRLSNFWTFRVGAYSRLDAY